MQEQMLKERTMLEQAAPAPTGERPLLHPDEPISDGFVIALIELHNAKRLWRVCGHRACRRARCCQGDFEDCLRWFPATANWLLRFHNAMRAGLSTAEAIREADRIAYGIDDDAFSTWDLEAIR
jgi:hypothetical protein